ncbi:MAG TPA: hypothetical protein VEI98_14280 [Xanthobacteraceae bacterium]|nr:hypothetical protein [Xanthobacteraceae bacterium]
MRLGVILERIADILGGAGDRRRDNSAQVFRFDLGLFARLALMAV